MRTQRRSRLGQTFEAARPGQMKDPGMTQHRSRLSDEGRLRAYPRTQARAIGLMVERPHGVGQGQRLDALLQGGRASRST